MIKKKKNSEKDLSIWNNYIKNPTDIFDKEKNQKKNKILDKFKYDLHGHTLLEANEKVKAVILSCVQKNYREILFITGKGIHSNTDQDVYVSKDFSKLKYSVPEFIKSDRELSKYISSVKGAGNNDGGEGAIIVKLKRL